MHRVGLFCLIMCASLVLALPSIAQVETPPLDATYCADGLRFNYPSTWEEPEITAATGTTLAGALLNNVSNDTTIGYDYFLDIRVYEENEFRELFRDSDAHARPLMDELDRRYSELFSSATLEYLKIDYVAEKLFELRTWGSTGEMFFTLFDSGFMVVAGTVQTENYINWSYLALEINDTITYDPDMSCASPTPTSSPPTGTPARRKSATKTAVG